MTDDYDLQLNMMEKTVMDKSNPSTEKQKEEGENDNNQEVAFFGGQL
jgi:hypothetical protein